eukprot:m.58823 g.58823  ORF g.58823 m.58823 type:complete len:110 (-) comp22617_c0_seq1:176-505(-)
MSGSLAPSLAMRLVSTSTRQAQTALAALRVTSVLGFKAPTTTHESTHEGVASRGFTRFARQWSGELSNDAVLTQTQTKNKTKVAMATAAPKIVATTADETDFYSNPWGN